MRLRNRYSPNRPIWVARNSEELINLFVSSDDEYAVKSLKEIVGRVLDAMKLTDQQRLDIIDPHSAYEIVKEGPK